MVVQPISFKDSFLDVQIVSLQTEKVFNSKK